MRPRGCGLPCWDRWTCRDVPRPLRRYGELHGRTDPAQQTLPEESSADLSHVPFALSMANAGMNTGGSQFFIVDNGSNPTHLDHAPGKDCRNASCHTIFGHVVGGMMHVDAISQVPTTSPYSTPVDAVLILGFTAMTMDSVEAEQPVDLAKCFTDLRLEQVLRQPTRPSQRWTSP